MQEKNPYGLLAFAIVLVWALWNYNASLHLLGGLYNILLPFIIGGCMAFIVNVLMTKLEVYWRRYLKHSVVSRFERPVCLLLSLVLIIGFLAFFVLTIVPELHASMKLLVKMLPPALAKLDAYLQQKAQELAFSPDELAFVQAQAKEIYHTLLNYLQNNKRLLLEQTVSATASLLDVLTNCVIGFVAAVYCLLEKHRLVRNFKRVLFAFCSKERAAYVLHVLQTSEKIFRGFVSGQLVVALLFRSYVFRQHDAFWLPLCDCDFPDGGCAELDSYSWHLYQRAHRLLFDSCGSTGENLVLHYFIFRAAARRGRFAVSEDCGQGSRPFGAVGAGGGDDWREPWRYRRHDYLCAAVFRALCFAGGKGEAVAGREKFTKFVRFIYVLCVKSAIIRN